MKDQDNMKGFDLTAVGNPDGYTYTLASALSAVTESLMAVREGKNYAGKLLVPGGVVILAWIMIYPQYGEEVTTFGMIWLASLVAQWLMANWSHHFGRGQHTEYVGSPLIAYLIPYEQFVRRFINPMLLYYISENVACPAIALLLKLSAAGQAVVWHYSARAARADADGRYNAQWEANNR